MMRSGIKVDAEIGGLVELGTDVLRQRWAEFYGTSPAPRISRDILIRSVAFRIQEETRGGLSKSCRRQLRRLGDALRDGGTIAAAKGQTFKTGTRLIREWKGRVHEVVIAGGDTYIYAGKQYDSLSHIARAITGTRWSGPRFFGLEEGQRTPASSTKDIPSRSRRAGRDSVDRADS